MPNELSTATGLDINTLSALVLNADLSKLTNEQRLMYYKHRCDAAGLDPATKPFDLITLQGKQVLYATKECSAQLSSKHGIVCEILEQKTDSGVRMVTVRARAKDGRQTDDIGCVPIANLSGADLANACMKAVTKAKRRAVLSLCGLGATDEEELDTVETSPASPPAMTLPKKQKTVDTIQPEAKPVPKVIEAEKVEPKSEPAPAPVKQDANDGTLGAFVLVVKTTSKAGETNGKKWERFGIYVMRPDGSECWLNTFDKKLYQTAERVKGGTSVFVKYKQGSKGIDLLAIDEQPADEKVDLPF